MIQFNTKEYKGDTNNNRPIGAVCKEGVSEGGEKRWCREDRRDEHEWRRYVGKVGKRTKEST